MNHVSPAGPGPFSEVLRRPLLVCPVQLGDFLLSLPAVDRLAEQLGGALTVAAEAHLVGLIGLLPGKVRTLALQSLKRGGGLRTGRLPPDLPGNPDGALLLGRHEVVRRGLARLSPDRFRILSLDDFEGESGGHLAQRFLEFTLEKVGIPPFPLIPPKLTAGPSPFESADPYVVIHPGNSSAQRRLLRWKTKIRHRAWPLSCWVELLARLSAVFEGRIVLTGWGRERRLVDRLIDRLPDSVSKKVENLAGRTSLEGLAGLLARASLYVGVDTGPSHLAAMLGTPTVALFGPTDPARVGPLDQGGNLAILRTGMECSPCRREVRRTCPLNRCLVDLHPEQVLAAAARWI